MPRTAYLLAGLALAAPPSLLSAQVIPLPLGNSSIGTEQTPALAPAPTPTPTPTPSPSPSPTATPTPEPALTSEPARPPAARPIPRPTATPRPIPEPTPTPTPAPLATPAPEQTTTPAPLPSPSSAPTPVAVPAPAPAAPLWPWLVGAGALALAALAWAALRRRRRESAEPEVGFAEPALALELEPITPEPRARLTLALRPTRAGLNLISATVECEVTVVNEGEASADDVRAELRLMGAHAGQEEDLAAYYAEAAPRAATPPFTLQPGQSLAFGAVAVLPREAIRPLQVGDRPMFVPLLAIKLRYRDGEELRRLGQAFAIGVERVDSAKLAPLWLDVPPRSYDAVAARSSGPARDLG